jgi:hypothetical protein
VSAKLVLGVKLLQMNKDHDYGGRTANQLRTWNIWNHQQAPARGAGRAAETVAK